MKRSAKSSVSPTANLHDCNREFHFRPILTNKPNLNWETKCSGPDCWSPQYVVPQLLVSEKQFGLMNIVLQECVDRELWFGDRKAKDIDKTDTATRPHSKIYRFKAGEKISFFDSNNFRLSVLLALSVVNIHRVPSVPDKCIYPNVIREDFLTYDWRIMITPTHVPEWRSITGKCFKSLG